MMHYTQSSVQSLVEGGRSFICLDPEISLALNMLSLGRKSIFSLPKWRWKNSQTIQRALSSSFLKLPSVFGSKTGEESKISQQGTPGRKEYYVPRKFVPMTRKALIRRIVEDEILVSTNDRHYFQGLAEVLDKSIAGTFHGALGELKVGGQCHWPIYCILDILKLTVAVEPRRKLNHNIAKQTCRFYKKYT